MSETEQPSSPSGAPEQMDIATGPEVVTSSNYGQDPGSSSGGSSGGSGEWTQFKKYLGICALILGMILGIVSTVFAWQAWAKINTYTNEFQDMIQSWEQGSVSNVYFGDTGTGQCPLGYVQPPQNYWGGVSDACNCFAMNHPNKTLTSSADRRCNAEESQYNCRNVTGLDRVNVNFFPGSTRFCYSVGTQSAIHRKGYDRGTGCPSGYKRCGDPAFGEFAFCVATSNRCPITDVFFKTFFNESEAAAWGNATRNAVGMMWSQATLTAMFWSEGGTMNLTSNQRTISPNQITSIPQYGYPVIHFDYQSGFICYLGDGRGYPGRSAEYTNQQNLWLAIPANTVAGNPLNFNRGYRQSRGDIGCDTRVSNITPAGWDVRHFAVAGRTEYDIFLPYSNLPSDPPPAKGDGVIPYQYLPTAGQSYWYLTMQTEVQWDESCPTSRKTVQSNKSEVNQLRSAQLALITSTILTLIIVVLIGTCLEIYFKCYDPDGKIEKGENGYKLLCGFKIMKWILKIMAYSCVIASVVVAFGMVGFFADITKEIQASLYCSDALSQHSFTKLKEIIDEVSKKDVVTGFTQMGDFLGDIVQECLNAILK